MQNTAKRFLSLILVLILSVLSTVPTFAANHQKRNAKALVLVLDEGCARSFAESLLSHHAGVQEALPMAFDDASSERIILLTTAEADRISDSISDRAVVRCVELRDGRNTYYISVDLTTELSEHLSNRTILRKTAHNLYNRTDSMKKADVLMDYTHIVGELALHRIGYAVLRTFGGEHLIGLPKKLFQSCSVADLNIDENRFPISIRIIGLMIG